MNYEQILYDVSDHIATITLNRPERLNAWTMRMEAEVRHACMRADRDTEVRVIVVTGAGKGYCAGADMDLLQAVQGGQGDVAATGRGEIEDIPFDESVPKVFRGTYSYPLGLSKPVIGAVNGVAAGLGMSYSLYYDLRIASDRARFGTVFARRGLVAEHGTAWLLPRLVGMANAAELLYSGRLISAEEALQMGLVNRVVPHDDLMPAVREIAGQMATTSSPRSLRVMKRQLGAALFSSLAEAIDEADREMVASFSAADFREGVASFLQKRPPKFSGR
jgi:enoyl-CoA hydratase/carnithine racemase